MKDADCGWRGRVSGTHRLLDRPKTYSVRSPITSMSASFVLIPSSFGTSRRARRRDPRSAGARLVAARHAEAPDAENGLATAEGKPRDRELPGHGRGQPHRIFECLSRRCIHLHPRTASGRAEARGVQANEEPGATLRSRRMTAVSPSHSSRASSNDVGGRISSRSLGRDFHLPHSRSLAPGEHEINRPSQASIVKG